MRRFLVSLATALGFVASPVFATSHQESAEAPTEAEWCDGCDALMELTLANPRRKDDRARDAFRHPAETLEFFRVQPGMKVGEYAPGGGWYSRVLSPFLGDDGKLVGLFFDTSTGPFAGDKAQGIRDAAAKFPADVAGWTGIPATKVAGFTTDGAPETEAGTYDRILVVRMMHNLMRWNIADSEVKAMRDMLKDDGLLGIVQHRAPADADYAYTDGSKGYLREADVIAFMELNGFDLVGKSEVNANPKDTANWEQGVWTLPPSFALKEADKAKYAAIGESDRMTLLFRKRP